MRVNIRSRSLVVVSLLICVVFMLAACGKKQTVPIYVTEEGEDGCVTITGLTDYGRTKSTLSVPTTYGGKTVTAIGNEAFKSDTSLQKIIISDGITSIGDNAFLSCYALEDIEIPDSVTSIGTNVFTGTSWEKSKLSENSEIIVNNILIEVTDVGTEYTVPDGVRVIGSGVFYNNKTIEKIVLSSTVEEIGTYAMAGCDALKEVVIPSSVAKIRYGAFSECGIDELTIPSTVGVIEKDAFRDVNKVIYSGSAEGSPWGAVRVE